MTDSKPTDFEPRSEHAPARRRAPDLVTLAAGLLALGISGGALLGGFGWLPGIDIRWVLAALAILVGLALVLGSVRPRKS